MNFRETDMTRALRAAKKAGHVTERVLVDSKTGDFRLEFRDDVAEKCHDKAAAIDAAPGT